MSIQEFFGCGSGFGRVTVARMVIEGSDVIGRAEKIIDWLSSANELQTMIVVR